LSSACATWQNKIGSQDEAQRFVELPDNGCRRLIVLWIGAVSGDGSLQGKEPGKSGLSGEDFHPKKWSVVSTYRDHARQSRSGGVAVARVAGEEVDRRMV
jgi:hypothetical protein